MVTQVSNAEFLKMYEKNALRDFLSVTVAGEQRVYAKHNDVVVYTVVT